MALALSFPHATPSKIHQYMHNPFLPSPTRLPPPFPPTLVVFKYNLGVLSSCFVALGALKHNDHHCDLWPVADTLSL